MAKPALKKTSPKAESQTIEVSFAFDKATAGTFKFAEVDEDGNPVEMKESTIGALYLRKPATDGREPSRLEVTVVAHFDD